MLDFSTLDKIPMQRAIEDFTEPLPQEAGNLAIKPEKPATGQNNAIQEQPYKAISRELEERERLREAYSTYQENIKRAGSLRSDILKGMKRGEDPLDLLLKAVECISLMTGDSHIYSQSKGDILAIYGRGLGYKAPLHTQLKEARERLERLERVESAPEDRQRVNNAIQAHRELITDLEKQIAKTQGYTPIGAIVEDVIEELREGASNE